MEGTSSFMPLMRHTADDCKTTRLPCITARIAQDSNSRAEAA
jgi:hypothetical protein